MKYIILILSLLVIGCTPTKNTSGELPYINLPKLKMDTNKLGVDDVIEIKVYGDEKLSRTYRIGIEGKISFPLVGELIVINRSPNSIVKEIKEKLEKKYFKNPQVTIFVKERNSHKVYILGEVKKPGAYRYLAKLTLLKLIATGGGFTKTANKNKIILRRKIDGKIKSVSIPASYIIDGKIDDIILIPGDIIFIPESWL